MKDSNFKTEVRDIAEAYNKIKKHYESIFAKIIKEKESENSFYNDILVDIDKSNKDKGIYKLIIFDGTTITCKISLVSFSEKTYSVGKIDFTITDKNENEKNVATLFINSNGKLSYENTEADFTNYKTRYPTSIPYYVIAKYLIQEFSFDISEPILETD